MRHYCTLFDKRFLPQGLALYDSLKRHSIQPFVLHVLAMDTECEELLKALELDSVRIVSLSVFEACAGMGDIRSTRTWQEYCWTCASNLMRYIMGFTSVGDLVTYLDADMMFFADPEAIFTEIGSRSIAVTPHRFTSQNRQRLEGNGRFNVSWVSIKNSGIGRKCVELWARQCREWCFYRNDGARFGDQKYLDAWPDLYPFEVCEIQNIGAGLAPWNLANYELTAGPLVDAQPVIFFHYHEFKRLSKSAFRLTNYVLNEGAREFIYQPYIDALKSADTRIEAIHLPA